MTRPQTKFTKVMFLYLFVILFTGGGGPQCMLEYTPPGRPLLADNTLGRHPPGQTSPLGRHPLLQTTGQQPGGTHPTGMHTCFCWKL